VGFVFAGYGTATGAFGTTVAATQGVVDDEQGLAGGLINMSRQVGAAVGVAVAAAVIGTGATSGASVAADRSAVLVTAAAAVVAAGVALRGLKARDLTISTPELDPATKQPVNHAALDEPMGMDIADSERRCAPAAARSAQAQRPVALTSSALATPTLSHDNRTTTTAGRTQ
jgi:hypothetical protein